MLAVFCFLALSYIIYDHVKPLEYIPTEDEIALKIQFDIKEDIGLLVFDYVVNGHEFSSGIANTDRSLILAIAIMPTVSSKPVDRIGLMGLGITMIQMMSFIVIMISTEKALKKSFNENGNEV